MLDEMTEHEVATAAGQPRFPDRLGREFGRERLVAPLQRVERLEHLRVAGGVRASALDGVAAVGSVRSGRMEILGSFARGARQRVRQLTRLFAAQRQLAVAGPDDDSIALRANRYPSLVGFGIGQNELAFASLSTVGEFLDQPQARDFLYPLSCGGTTY